MTPLPLPYGWVREKTPPIKDGATFWRSDRYAQRHMLLSTRHAAPQPTRKTSPSNPTQLNKAYSRSASYPPLPLHAADYIGSSRGDRTAVA